MTKDEFKKKFIQSGLLTWDKAGSIDFDYMYNCLHFLDSTVADIFEVPIEKVIKKRKELGIAIKKYDYSAFQKYKQQGFLKWDDMNYNRFDYLYNWCDFSDNTIAELFDVPKSKVTAKRKELGITMFDKMFREDDRNDVSSYLDFAAQNSPEMN